MSDAIDILAAANPAFGSLIVYSYVQSYVEAAGVGVALELLFLPIPTALSAPLANTFEGTSARTGLLEWISRHPEVQIELPVEMRATVAISRAALVFGLRHEILQLTDSGLFAPNPGNLKRSPKDFPNRVISQKPFSVAKRLGEWCGAVRSPAVVFSALGVQL